MTNVDLNPVGVGEAGTGIDRDSAPSDDELGRGRIRAWTTSALRDLVYCGAVFGWSIAAFTILVTGAAVTASLLFLGVGLFVWIGFVHAVRWTTRVDRSLAGWQRSERVPAVYRRPVARGLAPYLRTLTSDPQTWKNMAWLAVTSAAGFTWGLVVVTAAGLSVSYVSMPLWYWTVAHPQDQYGLTNLGFITVNTFGEAAITMGIGVALTPLVLMLARWCAGKHAGLAVRMLGGGG